MQPADILKVVGDTPHTSHEQGRALYDFVLKHRLSRCLELGFAHGVGTVWIAGALQELGGGKVISVDNPSAHDRKPTARELVAKAGLESYVDLNFDAHGYNWHLHNHWEEYTADKFDFIFLDGAHTWDVDALAFLLGDRILKVGGWFLFDDIHWSYASSPSLRTTEFVRSMDPLYRDTQQVNSIWQKLALTHPAYANFIDDGLRGWAQKVGEDHAAPRTLDVYQRSRPSRVSRALRKVFR